MTNHGPTQSKLFELRHRKPGNTIIEYTMIGSSTLMLALIGIQAFSMDFTDLLGLLKNDMQKQISVTGQAKIQQEAAAAAAAATEKTNEAEQNLADKTTKELDSALSAVDPYNTIQVSGANGIDIVDQYANIIKELANKAHGASNPDITFALMLDDLADEGHFVADDERSALTVFTKYGNSFDFSIQDRYAQTLNRAITYLDANPHLLSDADAQTLRTASNNITQQMTDFLGGTNPSAISAESINQKFTDAGGGNGATYVDKQASDVCSSGGQNCT